MPLQKSMVTQFMIFMRFRKENKVYAAPFAVSLNKDDTTYVEPDISVICYPDKLDDKGCNGAPDWIVEVVSYSFGMQENFMQYSFNETIPVGIYPGFETRIADLLK